MATVSSLTTEKIRELVAGWEGVSLSQDQINALISQLWLDQGALDAAMDNLNNVTMPQLEDDLAANSIRVSELNDVVLPNLEAELAQNELNIANVIAVELPALRAGLVNEIENTAVRPRVFVQPEEPPPYDFDEERELVVGDTWFDSDDNNKQRIWNGVEWSTFSVDIADFSITVRKFVSTRHQIY